MIRVKTRLHRKMVRNIYACGADTGAEDLGRPQAESEATRSFSSNMRNPDGNPA